MREIEWKVLSELMRNSKLSDRELARKMRSSQPTVTRIRRKLEKKGCIKEYTLIPDFTEAGYELMAITFVKLKSALGPQGIRDARKIAKESLQNGPANIIMLERGIGMGYQGVFISLHEDYASYVRLVNWLEKFTFLETSETKSFLVSLSDEVHYRPLTFSTLAKHLLTMMQNEKKE